MKIIKSIFILAAFFASNVCFAASLSLNPATGSHTVEQSFSVSINVASSDKAMNAASGVISFPTDKLQVVSVSKSGSIMDFWAQEPSYSNTSGTVNFEGAVLTPGYQGLSGKILTINFKGKKTGLADVKVLNPTVLANDGLGTPILQSSAGAIFTITEAPTPPPAETPVINLEELKPVEETAPAQEVCEPDSLIYSTTHPGQIWRKENTAVFSWDVAPDIVASRIAFDQNPNTEPDVLSKPAIVEKKYENVADGIWYFHLSLQNNDGWTKTEHFKIKIDSTAPEIALSEIPRQDETDPKVVISLHVSDKMSCVKDFNITIDGNPVDYNRLPNGNYQLETIEPGQHELAVVAYDRAGNQNEAYIDVNVDALPAPKATDYQSEVGSSGELSVRGETITGANVTAKITNKRNNFVAREDFQSGSGKFIWSPGTRMRSGTYFISFKVTDTRGASSNWSEPVMVRVGGGVSIDIGAFFAKIPPEVAIIGLGAVGIFLIVILTRALTLRRIRARREEDWR